MIASNLGIPRNVEIGLPGLGGGSLPFQPPQGISFGPVGGGVCPPGTRCVGPSFETALGSVCLGTCSPYGGTPGGDQPPSAGCPQGTIPEIQPDGSIRCVESGLPEIGQGILEPPVMPDTPYAPPQNGGACGCTGRSSRVITPAVVDGQKCCPSGYKLNKTTYYLCDGTCVPARTRCVKVRKTNPANPTAGRAAARRLHRFHNTLKDVESAIRKVNPTRRRKR